MSIKLTPSKVLKAYKEEVLKYIDANGRLSADAVIDISVKLFSSIQVKGVEYSESENDMLLFQYGTYDWGDKKGLHASFDITRQFQKTGSDEFHQLSITLICDPNVLDKGDVYNTWSCDYGNIDEWVAKIKGTAGYLKMKQVEIRKYEIDLQET